MNPKDAASTAWEMTRAFAAERARVTQIVIMADEIVEVNNVSVDAGGSLKLNPLPGLPAGSYDVCVALKKRSA